MIGKQQPLAPGERKRVRKFKARAKSKLKSRLVRSVPEDFARWDAAAERMGISQAEFNRRALNAYSEKQ